MAYIYIILLVVFTLYLIFGLDKGKYKGILILGFLLRILVLVVDLNQWIILPHAGGDSEAFDMIARYNVSHYYSSLSLTNYTWLLTFLYSIPGSSRAFAQFLNVVLGIGVLLVVRRGLSHINLPSKTKQYIMVLATLAPTSIILSGLLLREAWIQFFITLSILYFIHWFNKGKTKYIIFCLLSVLIAAIMHSGMVAVAIGYFTAFICYRPQSGRTKISGTSVFSILVMIVFAAFFMNNMDIFGDKAGKLKGGDTDKALMDSYKTWGGDSDYLTWLPIDNPTLALLFTPLKMFYFMFSPIPFDWRGLNDIISFGLDSCMYFFLIWKICRIKLKNTLHLHFRNYMKITFFIVIFVFGFGTTNAGAAMRHRAKILPMMIITFAVCLSDRDRQQGIPFTKA